MSQNQLLKEESSLGFPLPRNVLSLEAGRALFLLQLLWEAYSALTDFPGLWSVGEIQPWRLPGRFSKVANLRKGRTVPARRAVHLPFGLGLFPEPNFSDWDPQYPSVH